MMENHRTIALGCDHAGFEYKEKIKQHLLSRGCDVKDFGTFSAEPVDYPLFIRPAAQAVAGGECDLGIVLGGSGNGEAIVSNKVEGIRCAVCWNEQLARLARQHNDANMIAIGQRTVSEEEALRIVDAWLGARFEGGRHAQRIKLIHENEISREPNV
jgi:ribose 5-phosphate isomerase B